MLGRRNRHIFLLKILFEDQSKTFGDQFKDIHIDKVQTNKSLISLFPCFLTVIGKV